MSEDDKVSQNDEIAALTAIFGPETWVHDVTRATDAFPQYAIDIGSDFDVEGKTVTLRVTFPPYYPSTAPPSYEIEGPWLRKSQRRRIQGELEESYLENIGENVIFTWIDKIKEILNDFVAGSSETGVSLDDDLSAASPTKMQKEMCDENVNTLLEDFNDQVRIIDVVDESADDVLWELPEIVSGQPITDRKSTFQAHLARVVHPQQAARVLEKLKENKKIAQAAHNMWAFRMGKDEEKNTSRAGTVIARCDDDGETHAGSRMLHLLEILDAMNVMVVVSRWYGGIMLGPDRFKHISHLTRNILEENGFLKDKKDAGGGKSGKKKS